MIIQNKMEINNKNKKLILIGIIAVLILINLTALGTMGYHKFRQRHNEKTRREKNTRPIIENRKDRIKQFVKKELKLSDKQCSIYYRSMDENFMRTKLMQDKIGNCKRKILEQTISDKPDTLLMNRLCDSLGYYHCLMQKGMNKHFLGMMTILDSTQKEKLKKTLIRMNEKGWDNGENNKNQRDRK
jgi:hypothetical protein